MNDDSRDPIDLILQRVYGEFLEMPGLRLTFPQAQRLWALDEHTCRLVLDLLVETNFLCRPAPDTYARLTDGRETRARLPMAKAATSMPVRGTSTSSCTPRHAAGRRTRMKP